MINHDTSYPDTKITVTGGGIIAYINAYMSMKAAQIEGKKIKITIYEKNDSLGDTTAMHLVPSLTPDEMLAVIPPVDELIKAMKILFSEPGGIKVDVDGIDNCDSTKNFIEALQEYDTKKNSASIESKKELLLELGKISMDMWNKIYIDADDEFKKILIESNFNPCRETISAEKKLHSGYRIDLISGIPNAKNKALAMKDRYKKIGFENSEILSPSEALKIDPSLKYFVERNSVEQEWKDDATAIWRPGGCINGGLFLPKLHDYLTKHMGVYVNDEGKLKNCFSVKYGRKVTGVEIVDDEIIGLCFDDVTKRNKHNYPDRQYRFFPGEAVGTLNKLGFKQPSDAGFAGTSLLLNVKVPDEKISEFVGINNFMELHKQGIVLAWQSKFDADKKEIFLGVAGTKAFYGNISPKKEDAFFHNRTLTELNIINQIMPSIISLALNRETKNEVLTKADLEYLEKNKIARRWVNTRAVSFDEMPTVGNLTTLDGRKIKNAQTITHASCGGVSFAPALNGLLAKNNEMDYSKFLEIFKPNRSTTN